MSIKQAIEEPSDAATKLAEMILSDCGHSTAITTALRDRVALRIDKYTDALAALRSMPAEPDESLESLRKVLKDLTRRNMLLERAIDTREAVGLPAAIPGALAELLATMGVAVRADNHGYHATRTFPQEWAGAKANEPVAEIAGIDEYGPRLNWFTHWVEFANGTKLYATPHTAPLSDAEIRDIVTDWFDDGESEIKRGMNLARDIERAVLGRGGEQ